MDARENSKVLQQLQPIDEQEQYTSPSLSYPSISLFTPNPHSHFSNLYPMFSTKEFDELKHARASRGNSNSFIPSEASPGYSDVPGEHSFEKSVTDSSSEVGGDSSDEEVSLDELLNDGKAKKKIEQLAAMVGVDTTEPAIVLTEVVRVLKHLKRINQY